MRRYPYINLRFNLESSLLSAFFSTLTSGFAVDLTSTTLSDVSVTDLLSTFGRVIAADFAALRSVVLSCVITLSSIADLIGTTETDLPLAGDTGSIISSPGSTSIRSFFLGGAGSTGFAASSSGTLSLDGMRMVISSGSGLGSESKTIGKPMIAARASAVAPINRLLARFFSGKTGSFALFLRVFSGFYHASVTEHYPLQNESGTHRYRGCQMILSFV